MTEPKATVVMILVMRWNPDGKRRYDRVRCDVWPDGRVTSDQVLLPHERRYARDAAERAAKRRGPKP